MKENRRRRAYVEVETSFATRKRRPQGRRRVIRIRLDAFRSNLRRRRADVRRDRRRSPPSLVHPSSLARPRSRLVPRPSSPTPRTITSNSPSATPQRRPNRVTGAENEVDADAASASGAEASAAPSPPPPRGESPPSRRRRGPPSPSRRRFDELSTTRPATLATAAEINATEAEADAEGSGSVRVVRVRVRVRRDAAARIVLLRPYPRASPATGARTATRVSTTACLVRALARFVTGDGSADGDHEISTTGPFATPSPPLRPRLPLPPRHSSALLRPSSFVAIRGRRRRRRRRRRGGAERSLGDGVRDGAREGVGGVPGNGEVRGGGARARGETTQRLRQRIQRPRRRSVSGTVRVSVGGMVVSVSVRFSLRGVRVSRRQ